MLGVVVVILLPAVVIAAGDGNIRLLENEVAAALKACATIKESNSSRHRRSENYGYDDPFSKTTRIDNNSKLDYSQYNHERRNTSDMRDQIHVLNATDYDYGGYGTGNAGEKYINTIPRPAINGNGNSNFTETNFITNRTKRNEPLLNKNDSDQCLSQCVFANLQVVDSRGIPREGQLWNKIQSAVTSQQSKAALRDQIRACFQELQAESEDNGCSYSNKLERCLMLRFTDRKTNETKQNQKT